MWNFGNLGFALPGVEPAGKRGTGWGGRPSLPRKPAAHPQVRGGCVPTASRLPPLLPSVRTRQGDRRFQQLGCFPR